MTTQQENAVFVQTDNTAGNTVAAYRRAPDGTLTDAGQYSTGGLGGILAGSQVDHLASQGSLGYDARTGTLIAVNAGSRSVFGVRGDRLHLRQVVGSGGTFPVSVAINGSLVYVLNALDGGSVQGFRLVLGRPVSLPGSARLLGLDPSASPQYANTPGQVSFSPDGSQLIVTTKDNGNDIDVFAVDAGRIAQYDAVLRGLATFEGRSSVRTWLFRILVNRARTTGARERRSIAIGDDLEPAVDQARFDAAGKWAAPPAHWLDQLEDRLAAEKMAGRIKIALLDLPARQREVVTRRDIEGLSSDEVCGVLAITEANQRVLLHRGRSRLRQVLETEFGRA